jgi:hypothetical protein
MHPIHILQSGFLKIHFNIILPSTPRCFTCLTYLILDFIICKVYKFRSSSLCNFLQPPVTSSFIRPYILVSTLFSDTLNLCPLRVRDHDYDLVISVLSSCLKFPGSILAVTINLKITIR